MRFRCIGLHGFFVYHAHAHASISRLGIIGLHSLSIRLLHDLYVLDMFYAFVALNLLRKFDNALYRFYNFSLSLVFAKLLTYRSLFA